MMLLQALAIRLHLAQEAGSSWRQDAPWGWDLPALLRCPAPGRGSARFAESKHPPPKASGNQVIPTTEKCCVLHLHGNKNWYF